MSASPWTERDRVPRLPQAPTVTFSLLDTQQPSGIDVRLPSVGSPPGCALPVGDHWLERQLVLLAL